MQSKHLNQPLRKSFPALLTKEEIKRFSQVDNLTFTLAAIVEILTITLAITIAELYWHPLVYFVAIIIIGSRIHGLAVLMHDACHYRVSNSRKYNDWLGELISLPIPVSMEGFRKNHLAHHNFLNTEDDPDWQRTRIKAFEFPKTPMQLVTTFLYYALALNAPSDLKQVRKEKHINDVPLTLRMFRWSFYVIFALCAWFFNFWQEALLYWVVPLFTSFSFFLYVRSAAEHYSNLKYETLLDSSRTVVAPLWERWLFAPHGINYHIEHHLYPSVPYYRLPELHQYLMTKPEFVEKAHITKGYVTGLFSEFCAGANEPHDKRPDTRPSAA